LKTPATLEFQGGLWGSETPARGAAALPKTPIPGVGALAAIMDPQGNLVGLWEQTAK